jgi:hypothetical protein
MVRQAKLLPVVIVVALVGCSTDDASPAAAGSDEVWEAFEERSAEMAARIGDAIGTAQKARFLDDGRLVVVFDRFTPHLRLFSVEGRHLWSGGSAGEGPRELRFPGAVTARDRIVRVWEAGRVSSWRLDGDSLIGTIDVSGVVVSAFEIELDCSGSLLAYGPRFEALADPGTSMVGYLHRLQRNESGTWETETIWESRREGSIPHQVRAHLTLFHSASDGWVLWYRPIPRAPGRLVEFDCEGHVIGTLDEHAQGRFEDPEFIRDAADQAMVVVGGYNPGGVVKMDPGFLYSRSGRVQGRGVRQLVRYLGEGQVVVADFPGGGVLMDFHPEVGLLLARRTPVPHFVVLSPTELDQLFGLMPVPNDP